MELVTRTRLTTASLLGVALLVLVSAGTGIAQIGGAAYMLGYIDATTAGALGLGTAGAGSILTGLEVAGIVGVSTGGFGLVAVGGIAL